MILGAAAIPVAEVRMVGVEADQDVLVRRVDREASVHRSRRTFDRQDELTLVVDRDLLGMFRERGDEVPCDMLGVAVQTALESVWLARTRPSRPGMIAPGAPVSATSHRAIRVVPSSTATQAPPKRRTVGVASVAIPRSSAAAEESTAVADCTHEGCVMRVSSR